MTSLPTVSHVLWYQGHCPGSQPPASCCCHVPRYLSLEFVFWKAAFYHSAHEAVSVVELCSAGGLTTVETLIACTTYYRGHVRLGRELRATAGGKWNHVRSRTSVHDPSGLAGRLQTALGGGVLGCCTKPQSPSRKEKKRGQQPLMQVHRGKKIRTLAL